MARAQVIRFKGVTFRRYPDSPHWAQRSYYGPGMADRQRGIGNLHQEVWKLANGPIPEGCEIHHYDFNPDNNKPDNLVCLTIAEHKEAHRERNRARARTPEFQAHLDRIRPLAAQWHGSEAGRTWHREQAIRQGFGRNEAQRGTCQQCGVAYEYTSQHGQERFCSNNCKSAWRRASGVDDETRTCAHCGLEFTCNRYARKRCCNRTCAQRLRAGHPRPSVQPDSG